MAVTTNTTATNCIEPTFLPPSDLLQQFLDHLLAPHQIAYAHAQEKLPEPQYRIAGKRIYTAEDVQRVAKYFAEKLRKKGGKDSNGD